MGWLLCAGSAPVAAQLPPALVAPEDSATGVSQTPSFAMTATPGSTVQYYIQVDDESGFNPPLVYQFNQAESQSSLTGKFTGQDGTYSTASDAFLGASTATFTFYSSVTYSVPLSPNTQYWYKASVTTDGGTTYSPYSASRSFTTGEFAQQSPINNASVSSVVLSSPTAAGTMNVTFHIRSNNVINAVTPNGGAYNTADWVIVKFSTSAGADWSWEHAKLTSGGSLEGGGATLTLASDNMGAFLNHTASASLWSSTVTLIWDYKASGALVKDSAIVKVFTIPMVKIPQGSFVYNAGGSIYSAFNNYGGPDQVTVGSVNDIPNNAAPGWPNGFSSFYIMRYPITQGLYTNFLNTIPDAQAEIQDPETTANGQTIVRYPGNAYGAKYAAGEPARVMNYLSNWDLWRFLSWAALRPITEMEYQKAARDLFPDARTYPWGDDDPADDATTGTYAPPNEGGTHKKHYANFRNVSGGNKVLNAGRYMSGDIYRTLAQTGAAPYGLADMSGQAYNQGLNCSFLQVPDNGNGTHYISTLNWPTTAAPPATDSTYISILGGGYSSDRVFLEISLRPTRSFSLYYKEGIVGGRGVRSP